MFYLINLGEIDQLLSFKTNQTDYIHTYLPANEEEIKFNVLIARRVGVGVQVTGLLNGQKLSIVGNKTYTTIGLPIKSEQCIARGALPARLDTASWLKGPILVLHRTDQPTLGGLIELELERLMVRDFVLVRCQVDTLLYRNELSVQGRNERSLVKLLQQI